MIVSPFRIGTRPSWISGEANEPRPHSITIRDGELVAIPPEGKPISLSTEDFRPLLPHVFGGVVMAKVAMDAWGTALLTCGESNPPLGSYGDVCVSRDGSISGQLLHLLYGSSINLLTGGISVGEQYLDISGKVLTNPDVLAIGRVEEVTDYPHPIWEQYGEISRDGSILYQEIIILPHEVKSYRLVQDGQPFTGWLSRRGSIPPRGLMAQFIKTAYREGQWVESEWSPKSCSCPVPEFSLEADTPDGMMVIDHLPVPYYYDTAETTGGN